MRTVWVAGAVFAAFSAGCAKTYINPYITEPAQIQRQFAIDSGYCTGVASGAVPQPPMRVYSKAQQGPYYVRGTATTRDAYGNRTDTRYDATVSSYEQPNYAQSFADGWNTGAAIGAGIQRNRVQDGCLASLGWVTDRNLAEQMRARYEAQQEAEHADDDRMRDNLIASIPELAYWRANDPQKWGMAVAIDRDLRESSDWVDRPNRDRFMAVVERVKAATAPVTADSLSRPSEILGRPQPTPLPPE